MTAGVVPHEAPALPTRACRRPGEVGAPGTSATRYIKAMTVRVDTCCMTLTDVATSTTGLTARWAGSGHSTSADSAAAGRAATDAALDGRVAELLLVFCSVRDDLEVLLEAVRGRAAADTVIVGCTSMGELTSAGPQDGGVVVLALGGGFEVRTRVARDVADGRRQAGVDVAGVVDELELPHGLLMMLCDGLTGQQHEIVRGAHSVLGAAVPLVGGCAADALTYTGTYQFCGDGRGVEIVSDAVVGLAIGSDGLFGVGVEHGWRKTGVAHVVTSSADGVIQELDGRPALDVYLESTGLDRALIHEAGRFRQAAFRWPLGLSRRAGEDIRVIHDADAATSALTCLADVPQGALVWVMRAEPQDLVDAAGRSCRAAVDRLDGAAPVGLVVFDCGARKAMMDDAELAVEVAQFAEVAAGAALVGLYTYGEIARASGARGMHHLTCVTLAVA